MENVELFTAQQAQYVYNPQKWAYDLLKFEPDKWQNLAMNDYIERCFCAWSTGSGVGKTALLSILSLHFLCTRPFSLVPATAPSQHQLFDVLWAEIARWLSRSEFLSNMIRWTQTKISIKGYENRWYMVARTSRPRPGETATEGLQGFHAENILFLVDEASGVPDQIMGAVDGALTTAGAHAILASNPTRRSGYFFKATNDEKQREAWAVRFVNAEDSKFADKDKLERAKRIYGRDSNYYRIKVLGLPPLAESNALITPEQVFAAHSRNFDGNVGVRVLTCDPARFGDDDTVFYLRVGMTFVERHRLHGMDVMQIARVGVELFKAHKVDLYFIDEIGIGSGVVDVTHKVLGKSKVFGVNVGEKAEDPDRFFNKRAELFWTLREKIDDIYIAFETDFLDQELTSIAYGWDAKDARIKIESKDDIKSKLGRSPNDADSVALSMQPFTHKTVFVQASDFAIGAKEEAIDITNSTRIIEDPNVDDIENDECLDLVTVGSRFYKSGVGSSRYRQFRF